MSPSPRTLFLCGGLQSSGSTLVSWCFLQRPDMDGALDADNDMLPRLSPNLGRPHAWYKTTICCFRLRELTEHFADDGWDVRPLLVVRDVRHVWSSLSRKRYGQNGITAEDPPLRLRLRRFGEEWEFFRREGWPILQFERLVRAPVETLRAACERLGLSWCDSMIEWPKSPDEIANARHGNKTFWSGRAQNLHSSLMQSADRPRTLAIPAEDLRWLESEFREFNQFHEYPLHLAATEIEACEPRGEPRFEATRRYKWELRRRPGRWLLSLVNPRNLSWMPSAVIGPR